MGMFYLCISLAVEHPMQNNSTSDALKWSQRGALVWLTCYILDVCSG